MESFSGKGRLAMNLSLFTNSFEPKSQVWSLDSKVSSTTKSPRNFEGGVVGLGIVAALNDLDNTHDSLSSKPCKASILAATSPRSNPIPIANRAKHMPKVEKCRPSSGMMEMEMEMEMSESYTCVISHCGNNLIKKRVYFDDKPNGVVDDITTAVPISSTDAAYWVASEAAPPFKTADFLSSCYLCQKKLHGLDIFMYRIGIFDSCEGKESSWKDPRLTIRGEKAFCSAECRSNQMVSDEYKEKCGSEAMKSFDYSVSPCSGPMLFFAGVAAA
ncbi:hypothetical protein CK203_034659 [Vitis vinifera]|uniref:FLZ-type domain-containing protein n=1 Tax=Vitis vinifera TaxID=29760 RepID=A0A438HWG3_VITVI|nr:hypothetical protein CK203_034659 [Vitis vinifera]